MSEQIDGNKDYLHVLGAIKERIRHAQTRAAMKVNQELLALYWFIGEALVDREAAWGSLFISTLARDLKLEFPDSTGFSKRNLEGIRRWYRYYSEHMEFAQQAVAQLKTDEQFPIAQQAVAQLDKGPSAGHASTILFNVAWGHHLLVLTKTQSPKEAFFYLIKTIQNGWSRSVLQEQIESGLFQRQGKAFNNFDLTLPKTDADLAREMLKSPYNLDFLRLTEEMHERDLEKGLIDHIRKFLLELGKGFAFVGSQYNLNVAGDDFFLDLLFFNITLNCYVVFELKVGDFKPEYAGKLNLYVHAINEQLKHNHHNETIGVLLCKTPNKEVVELSMKGNTAPLGVAEYKLSPALQEGMPTKLELETELKKAPLKLPGDAVTDQLEKIQELIRKAGMKPVETKLDNVQRARVFRSVYATLTYLIRAKASSEELSCLFQDIEEKFGVYSNLLNNWADVEKRIEEFPHWHDLNHKITFGGFKAAGTKAFNVGLEWRINLGDYGYTLTNVRNDDVLPEGLYNDLPDKDVLSAVADQLIANTLSHVYDQFQRIQDVK